MKLLRKIRKLVKRFTRSKISTDEPEREEELTGNLYEPRYTQPREDTHTRREADDPRMIHHIQRNGVNPYQNNDNENRYRQQPRSRHEDVRPVRYGSERRVYTGENHHVPNYQQMYSYMNLDAAARNAPSQCQQQPGIRGADATPVRPHVRASNLQQRSQQIHPAPIGQSQSQWHHMGIRHRYGDVHAAERCRSRVDGTVQHKPLNRYQQPTPDTRHHRTIPNYSSPYGNTNTYRLPNRQESHPGYLHLHAISQRDGHQHNMPERHLTDEHRTERRRLDRNLPAISQRDGYQPNRPERHLINEHRTERSRLDRNLPAISQRDGYQPNRPERHLTDEHRTERSRLDRNLTAISQRDGYQPNRPERHLTDEHRTERSRLDINLPEIRQRDGHQLNMPERHVRDEHMFHTHRPDRSLTGRHLNDRRHLDGHRSDGHCPNTTRIRYANEWNAESAPLTKEAATQTSISNSEASTQTNNVDNGNSTFSPSSASKIISAPLEKIQLEPPRRQAKLIISPALIKGVVLKKIKKII